MAVEIQNMKSVDDTDIRLSVSIDDKANEVVIAGGDIRVRGQDYSVSGGTSPVNFHATRPRAVVCHIRRKKSDNSADIQFIEMVENPVELSEPYDFSEYDYLWQIACIQVPPGLESIDGTTTIVRHSFVEEKAE